MFYSAVTPIYKYQIHVSAKMMCVHAFFKHKSAQLFS